MNLHADFFRAKRNPSAGAPRLFAVGAVALSAAAFTCAQFARGIQDAEQALAAVNARLRALDAQRSETTSNAGDSPRLRADQAMRDYALSFPWNDVFRALESLKGTKVVSLTVTVHAGVARIELESVGATAAERAVEQLRALLPDFYVVLTRQTIDASRLKTTIETHDRTLVIRR